MKMPPRKIVFFCAAISVAVAVLSATLDTILFSEGIKSDAEKVLPEGLEEVLTWILLIFLFPVGLLLMEFLGGTPLLLLEGAANGLFWSVMMVHIVVRAMMLWRSRIRR